MTVPQSYAVMAGTSSIQSPIIFVFEEGDGPVCSAFVRRPVRRVMADACAKCCRVYGRPAAFEA